MTHTESKHAFVRSTLKHHGITQYIHTALVADLIHGLEVIAQPVQLVTNEKDAEIAKLKETLYFVERWANHHGTQSHMTAAGALSCIQHHPAIRAITKSYVDGKLPETHDPYAELATLKAAIAQLY